MGRGRGETEGRRSRAHREERRGRGDKMKRDEGRGGKVYREGTKREFGRGQKRNCPG